MFALRCVDVSLAFFVALYCLLSCLVTRSWRPVASVMRRFSPRFAANLLFSLRIAPFFLAMSVTAIFVLPSFVLLEPRTVSERMADGQHGRYQESIAKLTEALKTEPNSVAVNYLLGLDYYRLSDFPKSAEHLKRVMLP